ncbi:MAG: ABC transporter permease [Prevotellaceae bacterium]|jgi:putative ABC transport system permease protein|nr:ABC transporter permease [Prevotellaceae bacterium]
MFRYITRDKVFSLINLLGLAAGFTAVAYIGSFIARETGYDNFHINGEHIYRVSLSDRNDESFGEAYTTVPAIGPEAKAQISEVTEYARVSIPYTYFISYEEKSLKTENIVFADTAFFNLFSFPLRKGDKSAALSAPYTVVLSEQTADRLFGHTEPLGKTVRINGADYTVTGVAANPPLNSDLRFNVLASFATLYRMPDRYMGWNGGNQYMTYLQLNPNAEMPVVAQKLNDLLREHLKGNYTTLDVYLRPLKKLHLHYSYESPYLQLALLVLSAVALLTVVVAVINFVNLTTARSLKRIKEAGVRRALGARRWDLVRLFLSESLCVSIVAFVCACFLFKTLESVYVSLTNSPVAYDARTGFVFLCIGGLAVVTGILGGSYPALRLSSLPLSEVSKGGGERKRKKHRVQNALIVLQLAISSVLIVATGVVYRQLAYIQQKDIGFTKEGIINIPLTGKDEQANAAALKEQLASTTGITAVSASSDVPCGDFTRNGYLLPKATRFSLIHVVDVDGDFPEVYGIRLKAGRFFPKDDHAPTSAYVINERLAQQLGGIDTALGQTIQRNGAHEIIGIVGDFHYASLYNDIEPLIMTNRPEVGAFTKIAIKYSAPSIGDMLQRIEEVWRRVNPDSPFEYVFFDDQYKNQYELERYFGRFFLCFAVIAIVLAALGMLNLMAYTTEQRKKEIGIRKVVGASVWDILTMLLRKTARQLLVANLIAWPVAWYIAQQWLNHFAFRISIGWMVFAVALLVSVAIALLTVGFQAFRAATANPVEAIKTE